MPRRKGDGHLNATIQLECLPQHFAVCKLQNLSGVDLARPYTFVAHTPEELSLVCPEEAVPPSARPVERGWRCLRVSGSLDFSLVGVLAGITGALAAGGVSVFAVSTYNTDYLLVRLPQYQTALQLLLQAGYQIASRP